MYIQQQLECEMAHWSPPFLPVMHDHYYYISATDWYSLTISSLTHTLAFLGHVRDAYFTLMEYPANIIELLYNTQSYVSVHNHNEINFILRA